MVAPTTGISMVCENSINDSSSNVLIQDLIQALFELTVEVRNLQEEHQLSHVEVNFLIYAVKDLGSDLPTVQTITAESVFNNTEQQEVAATPPVVEEDPVAAPDHLL